jgi:hypothetical protein
MVIHGRSAGNEKNRIPALAPIRASVFGKSIGPHEVLTFYVISLRTGSTSASLVANGGFGNFAANHPRTKNRGVARRVREQRRRTAPAVWL